MHLPDSSVISFSAAVISFATAITGVVRLILEKKSKSGTASVPRFQKKPEVFHWNNLFKKPSIAQRLKQVALSKKRPTAYESVVHPLQKNFFFSRFETS